MILRSLTLGKCTVMHSLSEPSQVQEARDLSFFSEQQPISFPFQSCGVAGLGQVEVRELALCIHRQDEVLLNGPILGE